MSRTGDLTLRAIYIVAGVTVIVVAILHSSAHASLFFPMFLGVLLIIQGFSGA